MKIATFLLLSLISLKSFASLPTGGCNHYFLLTDRIKAARLHTAFINEHIEFDKFINPIMLYNAYQNRYAQFSAVLEFHRNDYLEASNDIYQLHNKFQRRHNIKFTIQENNKFRLESSLQLIVLASSLSSVKSITILVE